MAKRRTGKHSTCHVTFEDHRGDLHSAVVRVPRKGSLTSSNVLKLASDKSGHKAASMFSMTCSDSGRRPLPAKLPGRRR